MNNWHSLRCQWLIHSQVTVWWAQKGSTLVKPSQARNQHLTLISVPFSASDLDHVPLRSLTKHLEVAGAKEMTQLKDKVIIRCKLLYREWIDNKVLLCSTRNYIQYPAINHNVKEYEKECIYIYIYIYVCITEYLCCTAEINTTL